MQILNTSLVIHNICLNITGHIYQERNKPLQWTIWCSVIFHGSCWCNVYHLQKTRQTNPVLPKGQTRAPCDEITAPEMPVSCWTTPRFELSFHLDVSCTPEFLSQRLAQLCHQQLTKSVHSHLNTCQTPINHLCGTSHAVDQILPWQTHTRRLRRWAVKAGNKLTHFCVWIAVSNQPPSRFWPGAFQCADVNWQNG